MRARLAGLFLPALLLTACGSNKLPSNGESNERPVKLGNSAGIAVNEQELADLPGTPMAERVAAIGLLHKRNGLTRDLTLKPGEALRVNNVMDRKSTRLNSRTTRAH